MTLNVPRVIPNPPKQPESGWSTLAKDNWALIHEFERRHTGSSPLPQQDELELSLTIGNEPMHEGRNANVYAVEKATVRRSSDGSTPSCASSLPPLVAKIAHERNGENVYKEAQMYSLLQSLQGVIVPRCYGYYRDFVNLQETSIIPWSPEEEFPRSETTFNIFQMPNTRASLNIVLLERLGEPPRRSKSAPPGLREQWVDMVKILAALGIYHADLTPVNIVEATPLSASEAVYKPPSLTLPSGDECEVGRYDWRLIDFEAASLVGTTGMKRHAAHHVYMVNHLIDHDFDRGGDEDTEEEGQRTDGNEN
ncbi:hypothetical protein NUW54_g8691 [Trametes sanguinea]|uniref:Uncharacterized protein n=1 Tax=Trametes sanguinea TaxID=158606 RepID=A0ACC1PC20_9APHY|nr:hypothetical protein NUW54_g8691 [Trametes sanguinea]